jgi:MFS family permease
LFKLANPKIEKLPKQARVMLLGIALSALGNGLVLPYTFIYFHNIRGFPIPVAGLIASYGAFSSLAISPLVGNLIDKWGPKPVLITSLLVSFVGYCSLSQVKTISQAFLVTTICATGQSAMWPSQNAISTELTPEHMRERIYGAQFAMLNLGIGIGGLVSSLVVTLDNPRTFELLFIGDGISYLVYLVVVLTLKNVGRRSVDERIERAKLEGGWADVLADKTFVKFWFVAMFAVLFSYSQLEVGFTAFSTSVSGLAPRDLAWAYAVNTFVIAAFQLWVNKRLLLVKRKTAMSIAVLLWAVAWVSLALSGVIKSSALFFVILCQFIFALGEMIWSPILPSVVNQLAPEHLRGRYNAAATNAWQISLIAGPTFAGTLLGFNAHWYWLAGLIAGLLVISIAASRLKLPDRPAVNMSK